MCGIWAYLLKSGCFDFELLIKAFMKLQPRGPDRSNFQLLSDKNVAFGFNRLYIMDPSTRGDQPFIYETETRIIYSMGNGEIYNFHKLIEKYKFHPKSDSDCEIIPLIYEKYGIDRLVHDIRGEFAIIILDINKLTGDIVCHITRDPFGVRPLFVGIDKNGICLSSELKGQVGVYKSENDFVVDQFKGGNYGTFTYSGGKWSDMIMTQYYFYPTEFKYSDVEMCKKMLFDLFYEAVKCRLESDRGDIAFLLSGGLDSSAVTVVANDIMKKDGKSIYSFSVGFPGGTDQPCAESVAKHIGSTCIVVPYDITKDEYKKITSEIKGSIHTHVMITKHQAIDTLEDTIYTVESFDITTIRASCFQLLISRFISLKTDIKVLFMGDYSDEVFLSYMYGYYAPDEKQFHDENIRLLDNIHKYDSLRADRSIAGSGIEARAPFSSVELIDFILSVDPKLRMPSKCGIEKWLFRECFKDKNLLPEDVRNRKKEALSDGVSGQGKSWFMIIIEELETVYSDIYLEEEKQKYKHLQPISKESLHYRKIFEKYYSTNEAVSKVIPHFWMPKWCDAKDPSARVLKVYKEK